MRTLEIELGPARLTTSPPLYSLGLHSPIEWFDGVVDPAVVDPFVVSPAVVNFGLPVVGSSAAVTTVNKSDGATVTCYVDLGAAAAVDTEVVVTITGGHSQYEDYGVGKHYFVFCAGAVIANTAYNTTTVTKTIAAGNQAFGIGVLVWNNSVMEADRTLAFASPGFTSKHLVIVDDNRPDTFAVATGGDDEDLQAAIALATAAGGGVIYLPDGTYNLDPSAHVDIDCATTKGITFWGESKNGVILKRDYVNGTAQHVFRTQGAGASYYWNDAADSPPLAFVNLTLDGNVDALPDVVDAVGVAGDWTDAGGNVWTRTIELAFTPYMALFDGGDWADALYVGGIKTATIGSTGYQTYKWNYSGTTLSVGATSNPASYFSAIRLSAVSEQNFFCELSANPASAGRLRVFAENIKAINGQSDCFSLIENCEFNGYYFEAEDVRRGVVCMVGGNSEARVHNITPVWNDDPLKPMLAFQTEWSDGELGYGSSKVTDVYLSSLTGETTLDIATAATPGGTYIVDLDDVVMTGSRCAYNIILPGCSQATFDDCVFRGGNKHVSKTFAVAGAIGGPDGAVFTNCDFIGQLDEFDRIPLYTTHLTWVSLGIAPTGKTCTFSSCAWSRDASLVNDTDCPTAVNIYGTTNDIRNTWQFNECEFDGYQFPIRNYSDLGKNGTVNLVDCVFNIPADGYLASMYGGTSDYEFRLKIENPTITGDGGFLRIKAGASQCELEFVDCAVPKANNLLASYGTGIASVSRTHGDGYYVVDAPAATPPVDGTDHGLVNTRWHQNGVYTHYCDTAGYYNISTGLTVASHWTAV